MIDFPAQRRRPAPTSVYVFECAGHVKIGLAVKVEKRRWDLQMCCPLPIKTQAQVLFADFATAKAVERELHERFANHRGFGEWFSAPEAEVTAALLDYVDRSYTPPPPPASKFEHSEEDKRFLRALSF